MFLPDFINGAFECAGGFFIWLSVRKLHHDKLVRGVSWPHVAFFSAWGLWNLWFYPHLDQWLSFVGGAVLVIVNLIWLLQIAFYLIQERRLLTRSAAEEVA
jgi:membrane protein YdbS with pleckstrin-like domain